MNAVVQVQGERSIAPVSMTPMEMVSFAIQQGKDLAVIEKLMDLQERWDKTQARKSFDAAVSAAKAEIRPIVKRHEVDFTNRNGGGRTNYKHEDLADIAEEVDPILAKYGLSYRYRPKQDGATLTIICILSHRDGHYEETPLTAGNDESGNKNSIQSVGSTATYLQRYTLKLALGLAAARDDDGRGASTPHPAITEVQLNTLEKELKEIEATDEERMSFLRFLDVDNLADLPASKFQQAMQSIKDKARTKKKVAK